jgi:hypothetical protein
MGRGGQIASSHWNPSSGWKLFTSNSPGLADDYYVFDLHSHPAVPSNAVPSAHIDPIVASELYVGHGNHHHNDPIFSQFLNPGMYENTKDANH